MNRGDLTPQELESLRRAATQLRRLSGDPLAAQPDVMLKLIDQIELQALDFDGQDARGGGGARDAAGSGFAELSRGSGRILSAPRESMSNQ